ncbi:glutathione S-transferase [Clavulina sp. PMI_390]|nr:glutathione S-transferase [Clavulina sp. PMI_390]
MSRYLAQSVSKVAQDIYNLASQTGAAVVPLAVRSYFISSTETPMSPPITLYTAATPNGLKASLILEELKAAYPESKLSYDVKVLSFAKDEQKEPWFLKINPNGRIPALVHHRPDGTDFNVFESGAMILYLIEQFDLEHKLSFPAGSNEAYEALQWIFFAHGGIGPMQGQANHFFRYAPEKIPYGINRYQKEAKRLYSVLEGRLQDRDWLVGPGRGTYSIADINAWPWVQDHEWSGVDTSSFPNLNRWIAAIRERPAAQLAVTIPPPKPKPKNKEEEEARARENSEWIMRGNRNLS